MTIPEQAVEAALTAATSYSTSTDALVVMHAALTAALPYLQAPIREQALEAIKSELSGNTGELVDMMASAIRADGSDLCDGAWESLSDDRKLAWRGDAERALAAVKEYLTTHALSPPDHADAGKVDDMWLPIESAPKDGTEILVWRGDSGWLIASYTSLDAFPMTQSELDELDEKTLFEKDWFTQFGHYRLEGNEVPTHWMPLPAAPTPEAEA